uniref:Uncharacterized protein n=1 Tax=Rhizophora mucronata TaxID=61149 RepID=A0A2P2PST6_RHIMU
MHIKDIFRMRSAGYSSSWPKFSNLECGTTTADILHCAFSLFVLYILCYF